jgi:hypothetical protein
MKERIAWLKSLSIVTVLGIVLAGCATLQKSDATDTEQLLAAAGFKMRLADTTEKLAHLKTLTQLKLVPHNKDGKIVYIFADAEYCKCLYSGNQENNQRYQSLLAKQNIAEMNEDSTMDWDMWGPWGG